MAFQLVLEAEPDTAVQCVRDSAGPSAQSMESAPVAPKQAKTSYSIPKAVLQGARSGIIGREFSKIQWNAMGRLDRLGTDFGGTSARG